jgi:fibronectin-binding autotransporter adhesin
MIIDLTKTELAPPASGAGVSPSLDPTNPQVSRSLRSGKSRRTARRGVGGAVVAIAAMTVATGVHASSWTGNEDAWANTNNWTEGIAGSGDTALFDDSASGYTVDVSDGPFQVDTVSIDSFTSYTFGGDSSLTLESGIEVLQGAHSMDCGVNLFPSSSDWNIASGASLQVGGAIGGNSTLQKHGDGTLSLTGMNSYDGGTLLSGGTLAITTDSNLGSGGLTFAGNATLRVLGTHASSRAVTLTNFQNRIDVDGGNTFTLNGVVDGSTGTLGKSG